MKRAGAGLGSMVVAGLLLYGVASLASPKKANGSILPNRRRFFHEAEVEPIADEAIEETEGAELPPRLRDLTPAAPAELVKIDGVMLARPAAQALRDLQTAARRTGISAPLLEARSGYRSPASQERRWRSALAKYRAKLTAAGKMPTDAEVERETRRWVAPPNRSTHQTGRAVDVELGVPIASESAAAGRKTAAWQWLSKNAARFGFVPYLPEPWHWEYTAGAPS
jgi:hypothetical protein